MMKKESYVQVDLEVVEFQTEDVVLASPDDEDEHNYETEIH